MIWVSNAQSRGSLKTKMPSTFRRFGRGTNSRAERCLLDIGLA